MGEALDLGGGYRVAGRPPSEEKPLGGRQRRHASGDGFMVACFPVKIERVSAGWTRAVAIIDE